MKLKEQVNLRESNRCIVDSSKMTRLATETAVLGNKTPLFQSFHLTIEHYNLSTHLVHPAEQTQLVIIDLISFPDTVDIDLRNCNEENVT